MRVVCDPENPEYYYNMKKVIFVAGIPYAFLDGKRYRLEKTPYASGADMMVGAEDLKRIFSPEIRVFDEKANGNYVPAGKIMREKFGLFVVSSMEAGAKPDPMNWPEMRPLLMISKEPDILSGKEVRNIFISIRGKKYGELRETYWMEEIQKIIPYNLYVPSTYSPERPIKLLVALHGGRVSEEFIFEKTENKIQYLCEKYGYLLLCPNAAVVDCTYGCLIPNFQFLEFGDCKGNPESENPMGYSPEVIRLMKTGEQDVLYTMNLVRERYNIDEAHIYMLGNSMGGIGTFHLAAAYPGLFRAIAPCGGAPHMKYFRPERLGQIPIYMVYGTEDDWGADWCDLAVENLKRAGCQIEVERIGGGRHGDAWVKGLDGIFEFLERNL